MPAIKMTDPILIPTQRESLLSSPVLGVRGVVGAGVGEGVGVGVGVGLV